jgi:hypothetical protein
MQLLAKALIIIFGNISEGAMNNFSPECCHFSKGKGAMNPRL